MLAVIGDIHAKRPDYINLCRQLNAEGYDTVQLGDLGFGYEYARLMEDKTFDVARNKFFMGNHDQYDYMIKEDNLDRKSRFLEFNLGNWGLTRHGDTLFFFVRGAFSIDYKFREQFRSWWPDEEISRIEWDNIEAHYIAAKPGIMITHELPQSVGHDRVLKTDGILRQFGFRPESFSTNTGELLDKLFAIHQPKLWIFGHYHKSWSTTFNGTKFVCLPELAHLKLTRDTLQELY